MKFYRTGGDEFYIIFNDPADMEQQIWKLYHTVREYNNCYVHQISFAMGTSVGTIRNYHELRQLLKQADDAMYMQKNEMHKEHEMFGCIK